MSSRIFLNSFFSFFFAIFFACFSHVRLKALVPIFLATFIIFFFLKTQEDALAQVTHGRTNEQGTRTQRS